MKTLSLKKIKINDKTDNIISRTNSNISNNFQTSFSTENQKLYLLPPLKRNIYEMSLNHQSSVLSKYIENYVSNYIKETEEFGDVSPLSNSKITSKKNSKSISKESKLVKEDIKEIKINDNNKLNNSKEKNNIICLSERNEIPNVKQRNINILKKKLLYLTEIQKKEKSISPQISFLKNINKSKSNKKVLQKQIDQNFNIKILSGNNSNIPKSIDINQELSLFDYKKLEKYFRRKKSYQPNILKNWKEKVGIDVKKLKRNYISELENDVEYQSKELSDQMKLLEGNVKSFNKNIINDINFENAFNSLSLKSKININKALEETIGIMYLFPQLILGDFYGVIKKFKTIKIPDNSNFKEKYVFDEFDNLVFNCNLLTEVSDFFHNCFDVYLILINEVDKMNLNFPNFTNIISSFEKARYNMIYVINSATNAIKYYNKDIKFVNKYNNIIGKKKKVINHQLLTNKITSQFIFKKNPERQKKIMINSCLSENKEEDSENHQINYLDFFKKKRKTPKFKSIINTKLVKSLLKNCNDKAKNKIGTELINNQIDGYFSEEEEILPRAKRKVIKINL